MATSGIGSGTVTDGTGAISCPGTCSASYPRTTSDPVVTLTASPTATSTFAGWSGACTGTNSTCQVTLSAATTQVTAQFTCSICNTVCTNEQTDPANCGACGHSCLGGTCTNGACNPFDFNAPTGESPLGIVADSSYVYWSDQVGNGYGSVEVCSLASGACPSPTTFISATPNATSGLPSASGLAEAGGVVAAVGAGISDGTGTGGTRAESCSAEISSPPITCAAPSIEISNGGGTGGFYETVATDGTNIAAIANTGVQLFTVGQATEYSSQAALAYAATGDNELGGLTIGVATGGRASSTGRSRRPAA